MRVLPNSLAAFSVVIPVLSPVHCCLLLSFEVSVEMCPLLAKLSRTSTYSFCMSFILRPKFYNLLTSYRRDVRQTEASWSRHLKKCQSHSRILPRTAAYYTCASVTLALFPAACSKCFSIKSGFWMIPNFMTEASDGLTSSAQNHSRCFCCSWSLGQGIPHGLLS